MAHMRDVGVETIEPQLGDEDAWIEHVNEAGRDFTSLDL